MKKIIATVIIFLAAFALIIVIPAAEEIGEGISGEAYVLNPPYAPPNELNYASPVEMLMGMEMVSEDSMLELWFDFTNSCLAVVKKDTGDIFLSNPYNADSLQLSAGVSAKLKSQVVVSYYNQRNDIITAYSWPGSVAGGNFKAARINNGVEVTYNFGDESANDIIPLFLPKSSLDEVLTNLNAEQRGYVYGCYELAYQRDIGERVSGVGYVDEGARISYNQVYILKNDPGINRELLTEHFRRAGYDKNRQIADMRECGIQTNQSYIFFDITVRYTIAGNRFVATVPVSGAGSSVSTFRIESVGILPAFAAETFAGSPGGYLFVPDGSGAIIAFGDDVYNKPAMASAPLYKNDASITPRQNDISNNYALPVFGTKSNNTCVMGIIENGQAMAGITAYLGRGEGDPYFSASAYFKYTEQDIINMMREGSVNIGRYETSAIKFDRNAYEGEYSVAYTFLAGAEADYVGMAKAYRDYLIANGAALRTRDDLAFNLRVVGSAITPKTVLSFPVNAMEPYTAFSEVESMLEHLVKNDLTEINLFFDGWQRQGLDHTANNKFKPSGVLGGASGFAKLLGFCESNGINLYPIADMAFTRGDKWFDGFVVNRDSTRRLTGAVGVLSVQNVRAEHEPVAYAISPDRYDKFASSFMKGYSRYSSGSISFGLIGSWLNGNYRNNRGINRAQSMDYIMELLKTYANDYDIAVSGANAYCLPYIAHAYDVPMDSANYAGLTYGIPFLQMAIDGIVEYSAEPINFTGDVRRYLLNCIESKTSPTFVVGYGNTEKLRLTNHNYLVNINFGDHIDKFIEYYLYVKTALDGLMAHPVAAHERNGDAVYIRYGDQTEMYINYAESEIFIDGIRIPAKDYVITNRGYLP